MSKRYIVAIYGEGQWNPFVHRDYLCHDDLNAAIEAAKQYQAGLPNAHHGVMDMQSGALVYDCLISSEDMAFIAAHRHEMHFNMYPVEKPTVVSIWFDTDNAVKIGRLYGIMVEGLFAYVTVAYGANLMEINFSFRDQDDLDFARQLLRLPQELQAGREHNV